METAPTGTAAVLPEGFPGWVHNLNPFLIQFTEHLGIRWYGLAYLTGFVLGGWSMIWMYRRSRTTLPEEKVIDFMTYVVLGTMIGGRVGYALFYGPELLTEFTSSFPFWGLFKVWQGGMASHGGIAGIMIASALFAWKNKVDWKHLCDLTILGGSLGICFGRVANFINGELYGRPVNSAVRWAVKFPTELHAWYREDVMKPLTDRSPDHLPALVRAVEAIGISKENWLSWCKDLRGLPAARSGVQQTIDALIEATQKGNQEVIARLGEVLTARHPSQLYASFGEGLLLFVICLWFWRKPRKPGVVGSVWMVSYACVRIFTEAFRMPDAHIGFQLLGLTRGQWLSVAMLSAAIAILLWTTLRKDTPIGGWGRQQK